MEAPETISTLIFALSAGIFSILIARKLNIVPITILLITGVLLGPEVIGVIHPGALGASLEVLLQVGIAIILFEGALTLNYSEYKKAGGTIFKMLSLGVLITWGINTLAILWLFEFPVSYAVFLSSIIIVTGPTVIIPILRRVNLKPTLTHILHWEGILIDPIGIFLAVFAFEFLIGGGENIILFNFFYRLGTGLLLGGLLGYLGSLALNRRWVPQDMHNSFILMWALLIFVLSNMILSESGVLAVVVAGIVIGITRKVSIEEIKKFKFDLTEIFIAIIFVLLSAEISFAYVQRFFPEGLILLLIITLVTRPVSIFICTWGSSLKVQEKLFLSWLAPRGIIATSIVTLFAFSLENHPNLSPAVREHLWFMETFVFSVIAFTVIIQGFSAPLVAKVLKVSRDPSKNWVIVGAHTLSEQIAFYLMKFDKEVTLLDNNRAKLDQYKQMGIPTVHGDSLSFDIFNKEEFFQAGRLIALTDNIDLNTLICHHWKRVIKNEGLFRWNGPEKVVTNHREREANQPQPIWSNLAKPSILSQQFNQRERTCISKAPLDLTPEERDHALALMAVAADGEIRFSPDINQEDESLLKRDWLFLIKEQFSIVPFLRKGAIALLDDHFKKSQSVYQEVIRLLQTQHDEKLLSSNLTAEQLLADMEKQEENKTVCIGNQVALFPLLKKTVKKPFIFLFVLRQGLPLQAYDRKPIRIFFFIFAHDADSMRYLSIISHISKMVTQPTIRSILLAAKSSDALQTSVYDALERDEAQEQEHDTA